MASIWQMLALHRPELALLACERLLAHNPTDLSAMLVRAEALQQLGRLPEAALAAREAVASAPESAWAHYQWARMLGRQGALHDAESAVRDAIRLAPHNASYHGLLAQLLCLLKRPREALASANAGLALDARHLNCQLWRAVALENLDPALADASFAEALRLAPASALVHSLRGQCLLRRAEPRAANQHLSEALRLDASNEELAPLLRRARRWQHWPQWMTRRHQRLLHHWHHERYLGVADSATLLLLPFFLLVSGWRNRHDPVFRPTRAQVWGRWLGVWLSLILLLPIIIFAGDYLRWFEADTPLSLPQMAGLAGGGLLFQLALRFMSKKARA